MVEDIKFILKEEGEEGLKRLEEEMQRIGYPFNYKEIKLMDFYPLWMNAILLTVIEKLFDYDEKKFEEIGRFEAKISFIIRLFVKYFFSVKKPRGAKTKTYSSDVDFTSSRNGGGS